jgi:putative transposase
MGQGRRVPLSQVERMDLWRRWRAGESLSDISRALGRKPGSIHGVLREQGGFDLKARGVRVSRKRIERLMRENGIVARRKRRFRHTIDSNHADPIAPNKLQRSFDVALPNVAWVTDATYIWTWEGWLYLAAILDLCSRRVVGWAIGETNDRHLALEALRRAVSSRPVKPGILHHSDSGSTYASGDYRAALKAGGFVASRSRKGDCWDNAVAESFFASLKGELVDHEKYATRAAAAASIADYIESFYNPVRRHSSIGYISLIEYELRLQSGKSAA